MKLKTIFLCVLLVNLAVIGLDAKKCGKDKVTYCKGWILLVYLVNPSYEGYMYSACLGVKRVSNCLDATADECKGGEIIQEIDEVRQKLSSIKDRCLKEEPEVPLNMVKCAKSLQKELNKCVNDMVDEVLGRKIEEYSLDKIRCYIYEYISKCVVQRDEDYCGKEVGHLAFEQLFDLPEEIQENCGNSMTNGTLRGLVYDTVTEKATTVTPLTVLDNFIRIKKTKTNNILKDF